jgi:hypothetical protein
VPAQQQSPFSPVDIVGQVLSVAGAQASRVVQPGAAAALATTFGFPLGLTCIVLAFVLIQGWIDARDPKLRHAPRTLADTTIRFREENEL